MSYPFVDSRRVCSSPFKGEVGRGMGLLRVLDLTVTQFPSFPRDVSGNPVKCAAFVTPMPIKAKGARCAPLDSR